MKTLGIMANPIKPRAADVLARITAGAQRHGLELVTDTATGALCGGATVIDPPGLFERADAIIALGGDGTMLRVVRQLDGRDIPVMGVNIGSLGFLTSIAEQDLDCALECLVGGNVLLSTWTVAESVVVSDGKEVEHYRALNDVVLRNASSRVVTLDVAVDGDRVTSYVCDGLIVSTPAGSTGYSLSAGGPIVTPETDALVISLICPHTLGSRPLVVPGGSEIAVTALETGGRLIVTADGQVARELAEGDCVRVRRSCKPVRFIHLPGHSYFAVLRQKLRWSGSNL